jgi:hypothetical protein
MGARVGHGGFAGLPVRVPILLLARLVAHWLFLSRGESMADSEAAMIMAKVRECKRQAHDLRDEAHILIARAAIKGGPPAGNEVQRLLAEARSLEKEADDLVVGIDCLLSQFRRAG